MSPVPYPPERVEISVSRRRACSGNVEIVEWLAPDVDLVCPYFHQRFISPDGRFLLCEGRFADGNALVHLDLQEHEAIRLTGPNACVHGGDMSPDAKTFYFMRKQALWAVDISTGKETQRIQLGEQGCTVLGQIHLSACGNHIVVGANRVHASGVRIGTIKVVDLKKKSVSDLLERPFQVGHVQFSTADPNLIMYCHETGGASPQRMWLAHLKGGHPGALYDLPGHPWVTHETFSGNGAWVVFIRNPEGIGMIHPNNTAAVTFEVPHAWHAGPSETADRIVFDTHASALGMLWTAEKCYTIFSRKERIPDGPHLHPRFGPDDNTVFWTASGMERAHPASAHIGHLKPEP